MALLCPENRKCGTQLDTEPGSETIDTPGATAYFDPNPNINAIVVEPGFGVVWVESGPDRADSKVSDNECEWTRIDTVPEWANVLPVGPANASTMSLTLNQHFGSGDEIGSVSAASPAFASYIGKQFKLSGTTLVIQ